MHDSEFLDLLDALPDDLPRVLIWVDDGADLPAGAQTLDDIVAANSTEPLPPPSKSGGSVILTSGTTGLPKGAPRDTVSPLATAQIVDRIPFPAREPWSSSRRSSTAPVGPPTRSAPHWATRW